MRRITVISLLAMDYFNALPPGVDQGRGQGVEGGRGEVAIHGGVHERLKGEAIQVWKRIFVYQHRDLVVKKSWKVFPSAEFLTFLLPSTLERNFPE